MATDKEVLEQVQKIITEQLAPKEIVRHLTPADDLQKALDDSILETLPVTLVLQLGDYRGNFKLPARKPGSYLTITADPALLPPPGERIGLDRLGKLPRIVSADGYCPLATNPAAKNYVIRGLEFAPIAHADNEMIVIDGDMNDQMTDVALQPANITIDQVIIRGDGALGLHRGIRANGTGIVIQNSHIDRCFEFGRDCQAIAAWNSEGDISILNNYLEAASENVLLGGAPVHMGIVLSGVTIRGNHFSKNPEWRTWVTKPQVKNLLELKIGIDVLIEDNLFEYNWANAQTGWPILFTTKSQAKVLEPFVTIDNIVFRRNIIRNTSSGVNLSAEHGPCKNILIEDNLFQGISKAKWGGDGWWIQSTTKVENLAIRHNTVTDMDGSTAISIYVEKGVLFTPNLEITHNIFHERSYGIFTSGGLGIDALNLIAPGSVCWDNAIFDSTVRKINYPAGNFLIPTTVIPVDQFNDDGSIKPGSVLTTVMSSDGQPIGVRPK